MKPQYQGLSAHLYHLTRGASAEAPLFISPDIPVLPGVLVLILGDLLPLQINTVGTLPTETKLPQGTRVIFIDFRQAPRSHPTAPCLKPEPYSGSQNWEEYLSHFEDCAELSDWDSHSKVLFLAASLRGPARTYYMSLDSSERRNYSSLIARMRQRFGSTKHTSKWLNLLETRQRGPGESITALGDELRQLAKKAYRDLDANCSRDTSIESII